MSFDPNRKADVFVTVEGPTDSAPRAAKAPSRQRSESPAGPRSREEIEFAEIAASIVSHPRAELSTELALLEVPRWMAGLWSDRNEAWFDTRTRTLLTFDDARQLIEDRILELGLDAELVHDHPFSHRSIAEDIAFWRQDFSLRFNSFRRK